MTTETDIPLARHIPAYTKSCGVLAVVTGLAVLAGWIFDVQALKSILSHWVSMKANTALGFVLIGLALVAMSPTASDSKASGLHVPSVMGRLCAWLAGTIGALTLLEYAFAWDLGIDHLVASEAPGAILTSHAGRMAPESALCFLLLAFSLSPAHNLRKNHLHTLYSIGAGLTVASLALAAIGVLLTPDLGGFGWFGSTMMAWHTAILFALLGMAKAAHAWQKDRQSWQLGKMVTLTFALAILLLIADGLNLSRTQVRLNSSNKSILMAEAMQDLGDAIRGHVIQQHAELRGYIATGEERYLASHSASTEEVNRDLQALHTVASELALPAAQAYLSQIETQLMRHDYGQRTGTLSKAANLSPADRSRILGMDANNLNLFLSACQGIQSRHRQMIETMQHDRERLSRASYALILGGSFGSIVLFVLALFMLNSSETKSGDRQTALQEGERRYRSMVHFAHDAIVMANSAGDIVGWNRVAERIFGYTEEEISGQALTALMPERFRALHDAGLRRVAFTTEPHLIGRIVEVAGLRKDGSEFPVELSITQWTEGGKHFLAGTIRDITQRKLAEQQLNKLAQALEQSSESIIITDLNGNIEYANEAFSRNAGYSLDEVLGQNTRLLKSGKNSPEVYVELWNTLSQGKAWQGELLNKRKSGTFYLESVRISPIRQADGVPSHYVAIKTDITEHRRITDAQRESKVLLQRVIDSTPDWIYVVDQNQRFLLVNQNMANAFGLSPELMIGLVEPDLMPRTMSDSDPTSKVRNTQDIDAVFRGQSLLQSGDRFALKNGIFRIFDSFKGPLRSASNEIIGMLCYRRDITERFEAERDQKALEQQLRQSQKMEAIGHLTGGIAHDFNNILSSILGYAEIMQMSNDIQNNQALRQYLQEILQAGVRARELVAQLLTFSQKREVVTEPIEIAPIVMEVTKLLRSTMPSSISLTSDLATSLPKVLISPIRLHQILMNLCINSRDAIASTGAITIKVQTTVLDMKTMCQSCHNTFTGSYVVISVRDTGAGIKPANLQSIFDPFFSTKEVGRGSGMGLSILHGIVHSASGHIEFVSAINQGTEFRVYLPAQTAQNEHPVRHAKAETHEVQVQGTVMVVDDESSIVGFMTVLLEGLGCRVIGLTSATEALRVFLEDPHRVDLVITDQTMPGLSGSELAMSMLACRADIPIILSTGYSNTIDASTISRIGIRRLLIKPVPSKVITDAVVEVLAKAN